MKERDTHGSDVKGRDRVETLKRKEIKRRDMHGSGVKERDVGILGLETDKEGCQGKRHKQGEKLKEDHA